MGEKREDSCTFGGITNWFSHYKKQYGIFLKKLKIELSYNPAISQKEICAPMLIAALSTITTIWKQCKCPLTDEWIKKMWYIETMEYYLAINKNDIAS